MNLVHRWWDWCSESLSHTFAGVTAPILLFAAFFVVVFYATQGGDGASPLPPRADVAGVCVTGTPGSGDGSACDATTSPDGMSVATATTVPPTPTPAPRTYTVQAGDTLSRICGNEVPDMALDDCVGRIVELSGLGGPNEIFEGQSLSLPGNASDAATSRRQPAATSTPSPPEPEATSEAVEQSDSEPEQSQTSLVAIGPAIEPANGEPETDPEPTEEPLEEQEPPATPSEDEINASAGSEYTIEAGDSLLGICVDQVPDMDEDECMDFVAILNGLESAEHIIEGQTIFLP